VRKQPVCKSVRLTETPSLCLLNSSSRLDQYCRRNPSSTQPPIALTTQGMENNDICDTELLIKLRALPIQVICRVRVAGIFDIPSRCALVYATTVPGAAFLVLLKPVPKFLRIIR
jgi:hypothetical protein